MNDPNPGKAETLLRKSSWAIFVIGAGLIVLVMLYEKQAEESLASLDRLRRMEQPTKAPDYWLARLGGLVLVLVGLGCSLHANKLRKVRTGE